MPNPSSEGAPSQSVEEKAVRDLAAAAQGGDRHAFDQLVLLYQKRLYGLAMMMVRNAHGAEDVTQDAFIRAFTNLHLYDIRRPFYPWLATIGVRLAQNWLRSHSLRSSREGSPVEEEPAAGVQNPLNGMMAHEDARGLWQLVEDLPSGERTAVFLFYRQEMKVADIARTLGVTGGTVKTMLFRARKKLRTGLTKESAQ